MDSDTTKKGAPGSDSSATPAAPAASSTPAPEEERRYSTDELVAASRSLLSASPIAAFGALSTAKRKTHTLEQAQALVDDFQKRKVT